MLPASFRKISRETNRLAHQFASFRRINDSGGVLYGSAPPREGAGPCKIVTKPVTPINIYIPLVKKKVYLTLVLDSY
jgi:hypothetical protein